MAAIPPPAANVTLEPLALSNLRACLGFRCGRFGRSTLQASYLAPPGLEVMSVGYWTAQAAFEHGCRPVPRIAGHGKR